MGPGRTSWPARASAAVQRTITAQRRRRPWFDHLVRAGGRYQRRQGDLMAAGVTYFAFLGLFPVLLLVASVIGLVLSENALLQQQLFDAIREAFPGSLGRELVDQLSSAINSAEVVGLIGLADLSAEFRVDRFTEFEQTSSGGWAIAREYPLTGPPR